MEGGDGSILIVLTSSLLQKFAELIESRKPRVFVFCSQEKKEQKYYINHKTPEQRRCLKSCGDKKK